MYGLMTGTTFPNLRFSLCLFLKVSVLKGGTMLAAETGPAEQQFTPKAATSACKYTDFIGNGAHNSLFLCSNKGLNAMRRKDSDNSAAPPSPEEADPTAGQS
ncbi:hypothetical protein IMSAGC014_00318 [Bacteroidaceae bacterium]|nr:hypothetical protein IMSAGC014_00318 [Bacteroidaceae bacterium]